MMTPEQQPVVEITQADRDAARKAQVDLLIGGINGDRDAWRKVEEHFARHRIAALSKAPAWEDITSAPKDGTVIYTAVAVKWLPYKSGSDQFKRGIKGRWMESNGYGGWRSCLNGEPARWLSPPTPQEDS